MATTPAFVNDTINFQLRDDKTVTSDTVKVIVVINALVEGETTEAQLRIDIKKSLLAFIDAEWQISGIDRAADTSGYEKVTLRATARVNERENYNLENRARDVSRKGLQFTNVQIDSTIPNHLLDAAEKELRSKLLGLAVEEAKALSQVAGREYRVQTINYQNDGAPVYRKSPPGAGVAMAAMSNATYGGFGDADDESLSNTQKISLSANIVLGAIQLVQ